MTDLDAFNDAIHQAAAQHEAGDHDAALEAWRELIASAPSDLDRAILLHNQATTYAAAGRDAAAEAAWDTAIAIEHRWFRSTARANKAVWLVNQGRTDEAVEMFRDLAAEPWATFGERRAYETNVATLTGQPPPG